MRNSMSALYRLATVGLFLLLSVIVSAQTDPIVGTWNLKGTQQGKVIVIAVMSFNSGGTTVEYDTSGTNSSASPGESIDLGTWKKTANRTYSFKEENYIYDSFGKLIQLAVGACDLTLPSGLSTFKGNCKLNFYSCSLAKCPGKLQNGPIDYEMVAKRF